MTEDEKEMFKAALHEQMNRKRAQIPGNVSPYTYINRCVDAMFEVAVDAIAEIAARQGKPTAGGKP